MAPTYDEVDFKIPEESDDYKACSDLVLAAISKIIQSAIDKGQNKIIINTNLRLGLPTTKLRAHLWKLPDGFFYQRMRDYCIGMISSADLFSIAVAVRHKGASSCSTGAMFAIQAGLHHHVRI
jgi:hypothetical protein